MALLAIASTASADATVNVLWQQNGLSSIAVAPGTPLTAEIFITPGSAGISSYGVSLQFDSNDLTLVPADPTCCTKELPTGFQFNLMPGLTVNANQISSFEAATLANGPTTGPFLAGLVNFVTKTPTDSGTDAVTAGFFQTGVDGMFDNAGKAVSPLFSGASVPEPTTALLLVSGLSGLAAFRRRKLG